MAEKLTTNEVKERFKSLYNGEYELVSEYIDGISPITVKHLPCGTVYDVKRAKSILKENSCLCKICNKRTVSLDIKTEDKLIKRLSDETNGEYAYVSGFNPKKISDKIVLKHNECGNTIEISPVLFFGKKKRRCKFCANKNRGNYASKDNYLEGLLIDSESDIDYTWLDEYTGNNKDKLRIKHNTCGTIYEVKPNDFQQGYRCPKCSSSKHTSKVEDEIYNFIKEYYNDEVIRNYRYDNKEIDIYLPSLNIGFEINGFYWHCSKFKDKNYHLDKLNFFKEIGISIYSIEDLIWISKKDIVKSKILYLIKKSNAERIYARKCKVVYNIPTDTKRCFLNSNHIQGYCADSFNISLYYNDILIALITFGNNRISVNRRDNNKIELIRYVTNNNYIVDGGFTKLMKYAKIYIKENFPNIDTIYTYASKDISKGDLYNKAGFELVSESAPSYHYVYKNQIVNRFKYRKSELKRLFPEYYNENMTELEITDTIPNLYRVYNTGNYVFELKL